MKWYRLFDDEQALLVALGPDAKRVVRIGERRVCLFHNAGSYHAFDHLCPHNKHSLLEGSINHLGEVVCPLHGYRYSLKDGRECDSKSGSLTIHRIEIRDEGVFLGLSV